MPESDPLAEVSRYPLLDALRDRRSRRFGRGMRMDGGPLAFESRQPGLPLSELEEALLAFAACGLTGPAAVDLHFGAGQGGSIIAGVLGRTVASGDAIQAVSVAVVNAEGAWLLKRPRDFEPAEIPELVEASRRAGFVDLYRRSRVRIAEGRRQPPLHPFYNLAVNRWSLYDPAATYFLPIGELTFLYINGLLEIFDEPTGAFVVDERAWFRPAGLKRFARSRGGWLHDDPRDERSLTIQQLEALVVEFVTIEQGMVLQNLGLMTQALGLGGFPHWAAHPYGWLEALGFTTRTLPASRYLGMGSLLRLLVRLSGKDVPVPVGVGVERDGEPLLAAWCPPYHPSMEAAVRALVDYKFGDGGVLRGGTARGAWREPASVAAAARRPSDGAIAATVAYCEYVHRRYGRFPAYPPPFRTVLGFQAGHLDLDFYDRHYRPEILSPTQRRHQERWHAEPRPGAPRRNPPRHRT